MSAGPVPQHMDALQRANTIRLARAAVKKRIFAGELSVVDALDLPEVATMAIADLLCAQRRWGVTRARRLLAAVPMTEAKPAGQLTPRQRRVLAELLTPRSDA